MSQPLVLLVVVQLIRPWPSERICYWQLALQSLEFDVVGPALLGGIVLNMPADYAVPGIVSHRNAYLTSTYLTVRHI